MWPDGEGDNVAKVESNGRTSTDSDIVIMDERDLAVAAAAAVPNISQLNVTKSKGVHLGPKFVTVTQNVHNTEVVKGRFMGLELVSPKKGHGFRCSIAVFVCWAMVVSTGLALYFFRHTLPKEPSRLDVDLSIPKYVWNVIKGTTKLERISCSVAVLFLVVFVVLIVYFSPYRNADDVVPNEGPEEWNIPREMWIARRFQTNESTAEFEPLRLVIIQHTVSQECHQFIACAAGLRNLQGWFINNFNYDIPYNFMIGNDGRVYEGRGWGKVGAHTQYYNRCSLGIGFIGDYREELPSHASVTELQMARLKRLLSYGVLKGYIHKDYKILAAKDIKNTASPGSNLYNALRSWVKYDNGTQFKSRTCEDIYAGFHNEDG